MLRVVWEPHPSPPGADPTSLLSIANRTFWAFLPKLLIPSGGGLYFVGFPFSVAGCPAGVSLWLGGAPPFHSGKSYVGM